MPGRRPASPRSGPCAPVHSLRARREWSRTGRTPAASPRCPGWCPCIPAAPPPAPPGQERPPGRSRAAARARPRGEAADPVAEAQLARQSEQRVQRGTRRAVADDDAVHPAHERCLRRVQARFGESLVHDTHVPAVHVAFAVPREALHELRVGRRPFREGTVRVHLHEHLGERPERVRESRLGRQVPQPTIGRYRAERPVGTAHRPRGRVAEPGDGVLVRDPQPVPQLGVVLPGPQQLARQVVPPCHALDVHAPRLGVQEQAP
jgi:hypothetical protein